MILSALHLAGSANGIADALPRNQLVKFFTNHPQASPHPSHIPAPLLDLLIHTKPDWTSPSWNRIFNSIFNPPFQIVQFTPTLLATLTSAHSLESIHTQHQRPSSANLLDSLAGSTLSTRPLNVTSLALDATKSCSHTMTPSYTTYQDSTMFSEVSNPRKQRKTAHVSRQQLPVTPAIPIAYTNSQSN